MIRKTSVRSEVGVTLMRVDRFEDQTLSETRFRVSTGAGGEDFDDVEAAEQAFRSRVAAITARDVDLRTAA